jgi:hypothetical protein
MKISVNKKEFIGNGNPITDGNKVREVMINLDLNIALRILHDITLN